MADEYKQALLNSPNNSCVAATWEIAEGAAHLRANYNLSTPDAIQLATAIQSGAVSFLTNDSFLTSVPGLEILVLDQLRPQA